MKRSGTADLPLHYGKVPSWLYQRMSALGLSIIENILCDYGKNEVLKRLADPFWFQSFGAVLGMDWHSSGITTSVMGALKRAVNPHAAQLGLYICGGKGKLSKDTPFEIQRIAERTGMDGDNLVRASKLTAKVDNTAIQDGYQLYLHHFIVSDEGAWTVVQQGMHEYDGTARRYHWHSANLRSFIDQPHSGIRGISKGVILNLTASEATQNRQGILSISKQDTDRTLREIRHLRMPDRHDVRAEDINFKRLGTLLYVAREADLCNFEDLLLLQGVGPRTLQSLALISEVIHGAPCRFDDPARFSFAHGGKDGHPFPVPLQVYDEGIEILRSGIQKSKLGHTDKLKTLQKLHQTVVRTEQQFIPRFDIQEVIEQERRDSWKYGGKTVMSDSTKPRDSSPQLSLFP